MRLSRLFIIAMITLLGFSGCIAAFPSAEGKFERTLNVTGPVDLDVATGSGGITVLASGSDVIQVTGVIRARDDMHARGEEKARYIEAHPPIEVNGNSIRIGRISDSNYRNNVSITYEIRVPPDTKLTASSGSGGQRVEGLHGAVDASTGSGSIKIVNIEGNVNARTGSGGIELNAVTGRTDLQTGSGSIHADGITGSVRASTGSGHIAVNLKTVEQGAPLDVEAQTGSGGIEISGVNGSIKAGTGSGSIRANGNPAKEWRLHTSSGGITVEIAPAAAFDLHAKTGSGRINVEQLVDMRGKFSRNELQGKVRGGGSLVELYTGSGSISVR